MPFVRNLVFVLSFAFLLGGTALSQGVSQLWGQSGELWDPCGRLPDFSYAGYRQGEEPIPDLPIVADIKADFGAVGNGDADDTAAFQAAIATVQNGAVFVPAGVYVINDVLQIQGKKNFALRGEASSGNKASILYFPQSLTEMLGSNSSFKHGKWGSIQIGEQNSSSAFGGVGAMLSSVTKPAQRCESKLTVANASGIQPGDYVLLKMSETAQSGSSLRSAICNNQVVPPSTPHGPNGTFIFQWPCRVDAVSGNTLTLGQPLRLDVKLEWNPTLYRFQPDAEEIGIESLQVAFPHRAYAGHLNEPGYNGIVLQGALNCWVRDVRVHNADNFFAVRAQTKNCTLDGIETSSTLIPESSGMDSHYGLRLGDNAADNLITGFLFLNHTRHTLGTGYYPNGNVMRRGQALYLHLDHHGGLPFANLYSDIDAGSTTMSGSCNTCIWLSGGSSSTTAKSGAWQTVWNVRAKNGNGWKFPLAPPWSYITYNVVCFGGSSPTLTANKAWLEIVEPDNRIVPRDLYQSQLKAKP